MSKHKKRAPRLKAVKLSVPPPPLVPLPASAPAHIGAEYIVADIWEEDTYRTGYPQGYRGYLVLSIGDKWVRLFSPVSLDCYKVSVDDFDALRRLEGVTYDHATILPRIRARREQARKYGMFDGGLAADRAETLCNL